MANRALVITVQERPSISAINISGNKAHKTEQLLESLNGVEIAEGKVYKRSTLEKMKSELVRSYASQGRYGASVEEPVEVRAVDFVALDDVRAVEPEE